jgi:hypothetical protein
MRQTVSEQHTAAANIELREKGKHTIAPPPPKKSVLDKRQNWEARLAAQLRTNHWLSGVYLCDNPMSRIYLFNLIHNKS